MSVQAGVEILTSPRLLDHRLFISRLGTEVRRKKRRELKRKSCSRCEVFLRPRGKSATR